jgi:hypothetical protein
MNPLSSDSDSALEEIVKPLFEATMKKKRKQPKKKKISTLDPDPDLDDPDDFDTKQDRWVGNSQFAPSVMDIVSFPQGDDKVLIEYAADGSSVQLIENVNFLDTSLTRDGTSKAEVRRALKGKPLRNSWVLAASQAEEARLKTSNKAQEFALAGEQEKKKKTFEELVVPEYLHDFADVFADDGLNWLPPSRPSIDHCILTKKGFQPKCSKA